MDKSMELFVNLIFINLDLSYCVYRLIYFIQNTLKHVLIKTIKRNVSFIFIYKLAIIPCRNPRFTIEKPREYQDGSVQIIRI